MSTGTMARGSVRYFQTALHDREVTETPQGTKLLKGIPVFRAGTFKDSMGEQHTWNSGHLTQMVSNFSMLRDQNSLPNVPVRNQHKSFFGSGGEVVGYVSDLRVEGQDAKGNDLLVADMEITEPDAFGKIERGTWRSRSSEIGFYEDNDEAMYWPVFMGLAWVDLPAVEGLFENHQTVEDKFTPVRDDEEGAPVAHIKKEANKSGGGASGTPGTDPSQHGNQAGTTQEGGDGEGNEEDPEGGNEAGGTSSTHSQGQPPADAEATGTVITGTLQNLKVGEQGPELHASGNASQFTFSVNGQPTTDFAAVQAHITNLETVLDEHRQQSRKDFVASLAEDKKIAATQIEAMEAHALSLDDSQYDAFTKLYGDAPAIPFFAHHGQDVTTDPESSESEIATLRDRVKMHTQSGLPKEAIEKTASYRKLMELTDGKG